MNDPFLDINRVVDRLYNEYKRMVILLSPSTLITRFIISVTKIILTSV